LEEGYAWYVFDLVTPVEPTTQCISAFALFIVQPSDARIVAVRTYSITTSDAQIRIHELEV
jgi:hypothetical protein